jgi:hypothetical protein
MLQTTPRAQRAPVRLEQPHVLLSFLPVARRLQRAFHL